MSRKVCLITGATDGIGLITARELGKLGWTLALVSRNAQKGERVARELRQQCQNEEIYFKQADLSLQRDVRRVARDVAETYESLDILINNAGAIFWKEQKNRRRNRKNICAQSLKLFSSIKFVT
jgi:retinol dehydrogenase-13